MKIKDRFPAFTDLFRKFRPNDGPLTVFSVDTGEMTDYNVVLQAAEFDDFDNIIGDVAEMIVSKEWLLHYYSNTR